ncbi:Uncharacterized protein SCF082_LOCUS48423 [Durusdinium trenchii]
MIFRENEQVKPDTHRCIAKIIGWVMKVLMTGKYPTRNHKGELYPPDSVEAGRSGERFAGNWRFAFGAFKADLEARVQVHQLARNWQSDSICEHCLANKLPNQMVYTNFSDRAGYMEYMLSHKEFLLLNPPNKQSAWVDVPGWAKDRNVEDMLHMVHQGVGSVVVASLITHHYEDTVPNLTLEQLGDKLSSEAWRHYKAWARERRDVVCPTSSTFTASRFGRDSWQSYPELSSHYKAAMVKFLIYWAAAFLRERFEENPNEGSRLRAHTAYCLAQFQFLQDAHGPWFSEQVATDEALAGRSFLLFYQQLAKKARQDWPNRRVYKVLPKFHSLLHCCLYIKLTKRNPRYEHVYAEEGFMRVVSTICSRCHPLTMDFVALSRYRALIELREAL